MTARPNKALRALIEQHPEQTRPILDNGPELIRFMNEWAKLHAKEPKEAWAFVDVIEQERATRRARGNLDRALSLTGNKERENNG